MTDLQLDLLHDVIQSILETLDFVKFAAEGGTRHDGQPFDVPLMLDYAVHDAQELVARLTTLRQEFEGK